VLGGVDVSGSGLRKPMRFLALAHFLKKSSASLANLRRI